MKISRRDFIHAGCATGLVTLSPQKSLARRLYGSIKTASLQNPLLSQRNVINLNFASEFNYGFINHIIPGDQVITPVGAAFNTTALTWGQLIDSNGWPNDASASGHGFGGGVRFPASANFAGPYVITWDGDGQCSLASGTWTEASTTTTATGNANGTTTLSGFTSVVGIAQSFGITGTGVPANTTVVSVNYSAKTIVVSASVTTGTGITFTFTNGTYTKVSNGNWKNVPGIKPYIVVNNSGFSGPTLVLYSVSATGSTPLSISSMTWSSGIVTVTTTANHNRPLGYSLSLTFQGATPTSLNGTFLCTMTGANTFTFPFANSPGAITGTITYAAFYTNAAIYRQADEVDFMPTSVGGNQHVFRAPFKQLFVNANPAAIRFLNWVSGNNSPVCRFEQRSLPTKAGGGTNCTAGPPYGQTTGAANQYVLAASSGNASNTQRTTAFMQNGEVAFCRIGNSTIRAVSTPTAITQANPGNVTTAAAHGYSNGDLVFFSTAINGTNQLVGMSQLHNVPITVANATATTFDLHDINGNPIDTTSFTAFVASVAGGKASSSICPFITLQVGSGNDRVAYPCVPLSAPGQHLGFSLAGSNLVAGQYVACYFDKNVAGMRTAGSSPNWTQGVWMVSSSSAQNIFAGGDMPLEYCAALVAEVNIMSTAQGINNPVHMYMTMPYRGMLPVDPDYSSPSDWPINAINTIFAGGFGYKNLGNTTASLILEWSNELWNSGTPTANYTNFLGWLRQNSLGAITFQYTQMQGLRAAIMARGVTANSTWASRVYKTIGMQGAVGWAGGNQQVALGAGIYFTDPWNTWGSATPLSFSDSVNWASYFDVPGMSTYTNTVTGTGTFTDDSAMFNGTDNSANGGGNYTGAANPNQACSNFVVQMVANTSQGVAGYLNSATSFNGGMVTQGKRQIQYEGGANWTTATGAGLNSHIITANDTLFLVGIYESSAWATAQLNFFNSVATNDSVAGPMSIYTFLASVTGSGFRWAYAAPDTYATISGTPTEGAALTVNSPFWIGMGSRNQALTV